MSSFINLTDKEKESIKKFKELHNDCTLEDNPEYYHEYTGLSGILRRITGRPTHKYRPGPYPSHYSYILDTESGIGVGVDVKCNYCGKTLDVTDYDSW